MMLEIPGVFSADEARRFRDTLEKASWQDGRHTAGQIAARVKANEQLAQDDPVSQRLAGAVLERLAQLPRFLAAALPLKILPPRFNRYTGSGTYGDHIDSAIFSVPGTSHRIRGDLSSTIVFSEPSEYDGGELIVQGDLARHAIKLPAGSMILYPSGSLHQVTPVTRGTRFATFFWIQSLVRENSRRRILFDLDDTIQSMSPDEPDNPAVMRLTGVYHNLLREWAAT